MKTFRIWKSTGEPENIRATRAEFQRTKNGLDVALFTGLRTVVRHTGVVAMTEVMEPRVVEKR